MVISGYVVKNSKWDLIGQRSPQDPQAFYPATEGLTVGTGDVLVSEHTVCCFKVWNKHDSCIFHINVCLFRLQLALLILPMNTMK